MTSSCCRVRCWRSGLPTRAHPERADLARARLAPGHMARLHRPPPRPRPPSGCRFASIARACSKRLRTPSVPRGRLKSHCRPALGASSCRISVRFVRTRSCVSAVRLSMHPSPVLLRTCGGNCCTRRYRSCGEDCATHKDWPRSPSRRLMPPYSVASRKLPTKRYAARRRISARLLR